MRYAVEFPQEKLLSPNEQVYLQLLQEKAYDRLQEFNYPVDLTRMVEAGVILNIDGDPSKIILSTKDKSNVKDIESWIDDYRKLFKNKKSGAMGSRKACVFKMKKFIEEYPTYAKIDLILAAAQRYINSESRNNYTYLQRADYVISKKDVDSVSSRLATFCEEIAELENKQEKFNPAGRQTI